VLAGSVVERWREIGVRSALGASHQAIMRMVLGQGLRMTFVGVVLGIGIALLATRMLATLLFGVSHVDPFTYVGVIVLLVATSVVASALPAWRASRVDPLTALRSE
jgi:putative ABC transport system permease protein